MSDGFAPSVAGTFTFTVEVLDTKALTRPRTRDTATATFKITVQP